MSVLLAQANPLIRWSYLTEQWDRIQTAILEHMLLTALAVSIGFVIALGLAALGLRYRWTIGPITGFAAFLYTIPSVAAFGLLRGFLGPSLMTAVIPLVGFTILILFTNILDGFRAVPAAVKDAADGMGLSPVSRVLTVEAPLAVPYIINGLRIATVTTIGLVTVAAIVGYGGFGRLIFDGLSRTFWTPMTIGASLSVIFALLFDLLFFLLGVLLTPWTRKRVA